MEPNIIPLILAPSGIYLFQSWFNANGTYKAPPRTSSGLVSGGSLRSVRTEVQRSGVVPIGQPTQYDYIRVSGVSCSGCPFNTSECDFPTVPPCR